MCAACGFLVAVTRIHRGEDRLHRRLDIVENGGRRDAEHFDAHACETLVAALGYAIVLAFLTVLELFKDMGLSGATVQRAEVTHRQLSTLFWLNAALGAGVALLFAALAPGLAWFYDEPILTSVAATAALTMIFTGFGAQHLALLRRQMRFTTLSMVQTGSEIIAMGAALTAAASGLRGE